MNLILGDVIYWKKFPLVYGNSRIKPRWLIYIGKTLNQDNGFITLHFAITTTSREHQEIIKQNKFLLLKNENYPFFTLDSYTYFNEPIKEIQQNILDSAIAENHIEKKGTLTRNTIKGIYFGIWGSEYISFINKEFIYNYYLSSGFTNQEIPQPKEDL